MEQSLWSDVLSSFSKLHFFENKSVQIIVIRIKKINVQDVIKMILKNGMYAVACQRWIRTNLRSGQYPSNFFKNTSNQKENQEPNLVNPRPNWSQMSKPEKGTQPISIAHQLLRAMHFVRSNIFLFVKKINVWNLIKIILKKIVTCIN